MKILMRNHNNEKWQLVQSAAYANENELQKLLQDQPSLISIEEAREGAGTLVAAIREFPLDIGSVDLVGFSADGDIAVVECKLASNEEIKRKVIGQVFEYGANLWGMTYAELDQKTAQRTDRSLADLVRDGVSDPDWDEEGFRTNVEEALQTGDFVLIIVVDEIDEGLSRIVRFINAAGKPAFSLAALEMRKFQKEHTEILVPHLFGTVSPTRQASGGPRKQWTEEQFFETARASLAPELVDVMQDLYAWSKATAKKVVFGTGKVTGSFSAQFQCKDKVIPFISVYSSGYISIYFPGLSSQIDRAMLEGFHQSLTAIPGFASIPADFNKWPSVKIGDVFLNKPEALAQFKAVVEKFRKGLLQPNTL